MEKIDKLITFYKQLWQESKKSLDKARENTSLKVNRERVIQETARKECYADFINHLVGLRKSIKP